MRKAKPTRATDVSKVLIESALALREKAERLKFAAPVTHVYNPLRYAWVGGCSVCCSSPTAVPL